MTTNITTRIWQGVNSLKNVLTKRVFGRATMGVVAALAVSLVSVTAFSAPAAASISDCPDPWPGRRVCFWPDINYGGNIYYRNDPVPGICYNLPSSINDTTSSLYNRTGYYLYVFKDANCSNSWGYYSPYGAYAWVGDYSNDLITSYKIQ